MTATKAGEAGAKLQGSLWHIHAANGSIHVVNKALLPEQGRGFGWKVPRMSGTSPFKYFVHSLK